MIHLLHRHSATTGRYSTGTGSTPHCRRGLFSCKSAHCRFGGFNGTDAHQVAKDTQYTFHKNHHSIRDRERTAATGDTSERKRSRALKKFGKKAVLQ